MKRMVTLLMAGVLALGLVGLNFHTVSKYSSASR